MLIGWKALPGGFLWTTSDHKSATCPCSKEGQQPPVQHQENTSRWREMILPLCSALLRHIWILGPVLGFPVYNGGTDITEQVHWKPWRWLRDQSFSHTRRHLESCDCEVWERESLTETLFMCVYLYMYIYICIWWKDVKKTELDSSQWCLVKEQGAKGTNRISWNSTQTPENTLFCWVWSCTRPGCPVGLWVLHPWRFSETDWKLTQAICCG